MIFTYFAQRPPLYTTSVYSGCDTIPPPDARKVEGEEDHPTNPGCHQLISPPFSQNPNATRTLVSHQPEIIKS